MMNVGERERKKERTEFEQSKKSVLNTKMKKLGAPGKGDEGFAAS
jgi:hypothetical protein